MCDAHGVGSTQAPLTCLINKYRLRACSSKDISNRVRSRQQCNSAFCYQTYVRIRTVPARISHAFKLHELASRQWLLKFTAQSRWQEMCLLTGTSRSLQSSSGRPSCHPMDALEAEFSRLQHQRKGHEAPAQSICAILCLKLCRYGFR